MALTLVTPYSISVTALLLFSFGVQNFVICRIGRRVAWDAGSGEERSRASRGIPQSGEHLLHELHTAVHAQGAIRWRGWLGLILLCLVRGQL